MIFFMIGMPLAGKSTVAKELCDRLGKRTPRLSTGDISRGMGTDVEPSILERDMSDRADAAIRERVHMECQASFDAQYDLVVDGYPRSVDQYEAVKGFPHRVVWVRENPLVIADRMASRQVEEGRRDDVIDVVAARVRRSLEYLPEIREASGDRFIAVDGGDTEGAVEAVLRAAERKA